jgi:hypothetical protein
MQIQAERAGTAWKIEIIDGRQLKDVEETGKQPRGKRDEVRTTEAGIESI